MNTPPRSKVRLSCRRLRKEPESTDHTTLPQTSTPTSAPVSNKSKQNDICNDDSPIYFPSTQERNEDIDVIWDWNSPQLHKQDKSRRKIKRLMCTQSPKPVIKRVPSNNQNFDKLRQELLDLQAQLALPDDEVCLIVSPQQELEYKASESEQVRPVEDFDDIFNDSVEEQLVQFTQQVESDLEKHNNNKSTHTLCNNTAIDVIINKYTVKVDDKTPNTADDSLDKALSDLPIEDLQKRIITTKAKSFQRTVSNDSFEKISNRKTISTVSGKMELHRTRSFELEAVQQNQGIPKSVLDEIERKRQQALARLAARKRHDSNKAPTINTTTISPIKCSPEEIEMKRQQALAKLEAKKLNDMIERNRQEALKRLQRNRMSNVGLVKSTLTKRF